jgi:hypothetical protein
MSRQKPKPKKLIGEYPNTTPLPGNLNRLYKMGDPDPQRFFEYKYKDQSSVMRQALQDAMRGRVYTPPWQDLPEGKRIKGFFLNSPMLMGVRRVSPKIPIINQKEFSAVAKKLCQKKTKLYNYFKIVIPPIEHIDFEKIFTSFVAGKLEELHEATSLSSIYYWLCHFSVDVIYYQAQGKFLDKKKSRNSRIISAVDTLMEENIFGESPWLSLAFWKTLQHEFYCNSLFYNDNTKYAPLNENFIELHRITSDSGNITKDVLAEIMTTIIKHLDKRERIFPDLFKDKVKGAHDEAGVNAIIYSRLKDQLRKAKDWEDNAEPGFDITYMR